MSSMTPELKVPSSAAPAFMPVTIAEPSTGGTQPAHDGRLLPAASDRPAWDGLRQSLPASLVERLALQVAQARTHQAQPILASHYRAYMATGQRTELDAILEARKTSLTYLALGLAMFDDQACMASLEDLIWNTCELTTWVTPAVARGLPDWKPEGFEVELNPAMTGVLLATICHLLEDRLDARVRQRVVQCLSQRVVEPFLNRDYWWLHPPRGRRLNNWTAVCSAGALACVTLMPELMASRQAIIGRCLGSLMSFMDTFDAQGGCEEGGSYWVYGVDYLTLAAELLRLDPAGPDLYRHPRFKAIAGYLPRIFIGDRQWITYSDCRQRPRVNPGTLARLAQRLQGPAAAALARRCDAHPEFLAREATLLHSLAWWPLSSLSSSPAACEEAGEACVFFADLGWMISRADPRNNPAAADALVLSAHAGHNGCSHNHNDVGHLSVYSRTRPLLVDLGMPVYDRDYFSPRRMDYLVASSRGHSVPQVNGHCQLRGEAYHARVLSQSHTPCRDELSMDLAGAYGGEAGLASLVRSIALVRPVGHALKRGNSRDQGRVEVSDTYAFSDASQERWQFVSALLTTGRVTPLAPGRWRIEVGQAAGVIAFDPAQVQCDLEMFRGVQLADEVVDCTRLCLSPCQPVKAGQVAWTLEPAD